MCKAEGMGIAPWGSLGGGNFKSEEARRSNEGRKSEASDADVKVSLALEAIAHRKNTAITSIALAYVMQKTPYVFPIVGGRKVEHLKANIEALTIELSDQDIQEIEAAVPFDLGFPHSFLWGKQLPTESLQDIWLLSTAGSFDHIAEAKVSAPELATRMREETGLTNRFSAHTTHDEWRIVSLIQDLSLAMVALQIMYRCTREPRHVPP